MTHIELRDWLDAEGMSQLALSCMLDVNFRTVRRWCADKARIPEGLQGRLHSATDDEIEQAMETARQMRLAYREGRDVDGRS